ALALLCAATMQASAQYPNGFYVDGNALMTWCQPRNAAGPNNPLCIGFVAGGSDAVNFSRQFTGQGPNGPRGRYLSWRPPSCSGKDEARRIAANIANSLGRGFLDLNQIKRPCTNNNLFRVAGRIHV